MVAALREEQRTITERRPVAGVAATAGPHTVQTAEAEARAEGGAADMQPPPPQPDSSHGAVPQREGGGMPATDADAVPPAQPGWAASMPDAGSKPSLNPSSDANPTPPADDSRRAAAACSALEADAPELLEALKQHGIVEKLALLDDVSAVGRSKAAVGASNTALSQVAPVSVL